MSVPTLPNNAVRVVLGGSRRHAYVDHSAADAVIAAGPWFRSAQGYAVNSDSVLMHRFVLGLVDRRHDGARSEHVDHINGNKLDNRRGNLRIGTSINRLNAKVDSRNRTGIKGVGQRADGKWFANWKLSGQPRVWRFFDDMESAVACRAAFNAEHQLQNAGALPRAGAA